MKHNQKRFIVSARKPNDSFILRFCMNDFEAHEEVRKVMEENPQIDSVGIYKIAESASRTLSIVWNEE